MSAANQAKNARFFAQLLKDHHHRIIRVRPSQLKQMTTEKGLRDVRKSGVDELKLAVKRSGWARTPLIASDREDGSGPRLLEGFHRAQALFELFNEKDTDWLLRNETPETFRVEVTVLKGLTVEQELQISRESNFVNSSNVVMSLADQVVAMRMALQTCVAADEDLTQLVEVSREILFKHHPDYEHYSKSSITLWKRLAAKLGESAFTFMKKLHKKGPQLGNGQVSRAFSRKTLLHSKFLKHLGEPHFHGAQLWYITRVVEMERRDGVKRFGAHFFEKEAELMKHKAEVCEYFSAFASNQGMNWFSRALHRFVMHGHPRRQKGSNKEFLEYHQIVCLENFCKKYIISDDSDNAWLDARVTKGRSEDSEVEDTARQSIPCFPFFLRKLAAEVDFENNLDSFDEFVRTGTKVIFTTD